MLLRLRTSIVSISIMLCYCISLPNSMFSDVMLEPEINHGGNIYITGIGKYYKSDFFFFLKRQLLNIHRHTTLLAAPASDSSTTGWWQHPQKQWDPSGLDIWVTSPSLNQHQGQGECDALPPSWSWVRGPPKATYLAWSPHVNQGCHWKKGEWLLQKPQTITACKAVAYT